MDIFNNGKIENAIRNIKSQLGIIEKAIEKEKVEFSKAKSDDAMADEYQPPQEVYAEDIANKISEPY